MPPAYWNVTTFYRIYGFGNKADEFLASKVSSLHMKTVIMSSSKKITRVFSASALSAMASHP
jgi:predicted GNAT family N-acyltransferase